MTKQTYRKLAFFFSWLPFISVFIFWLLTVEDVVKTVTPILASLLFTSIVGCYIYFCIKLWDKAKGGDIK